MAFTALDVKKLREMTNVGMMDCKKALQATDGDMDAAVDWLREKGLAKAAKKADRVAAEGVAYAAVVNGIGVVIEVNSETDFVAKNELFREFVKNLLKTIIANKPADVEALMSCKYAGEDCTVDEKLKEMIFKIGEKLSIRRFAVTEGITSTYIHGIGSIGVIVRFDTDVADKEGFAQFAKNIALQVGAYTTPYINRDQVPASVLEAETAIVRAQIENDPALSKKPDAIKEKMAVGRLNKFYENNCLLDMEYFLEDSMKVGQYIEKTAKELGGKIVVAEMYRFEKGEGIQKKEEDFAAEIEKLAGGNK